MVLQLRRLKAFIFETLQRFSYRPWLILVVITILAYTFVGIFYKIVNLTMLNTKTGKGITEQTVAEDILPKEPLDFYTVIIERNLFGSTDKALSDKRAEISNETASVPDISMILNLRGTVAGDGEYGCAVIEERGKNEQGFYKIGDKVAGAVLVKIMRNAVVIRDGTQTKTIKMEETVERPLVPPGSGERKNIANTLGIITLSRTEMDGVLKDMGSMLRQAQVRPYFASGKPEGFMISNIQQESVYHKMGLIDGDIVQGVNDEKIQYAYDMVKLYNILKTGRQMSVMVTRNRQPQTFQYAFK
jgi:type II secretion system protein C